MLTENPLAGMKRPKPPPRQRAMSDAEFRTLYENAGGPFADFLFALRETGARPQELRNLLWDQVQDDRWVLGKHKTVRTTGKARVIIPSEGLKALVGRLKGNGHTHVFLNTEGEPWTVTVTGSGRGGPWPNWPGQPAAGHQLRSHSSPSHRKQVGRAAGAGHASPLDSPLKPQNRL